CTKSKSDYGGAPVHEANAPPDAPKSPGQCESEQMKYYERGGDLAVDAYPEAVHGFLEALKHVDGLEEDHVGAQGEGGDAQVVGAAADDFGVAGEPGHHVASEQIEQAAACDHHY